MRRSIACFLLILLLLTACTAERELPPAAFTVATATENFTDGENGVMLLYPVIEGYADAEAEAQINETIAAYARQMYQNEVPPTAEDGGYYYDATDVRVTLASGGFLSAVIGGTVTSAFSGNTTYFSYTVNCDIESAALYTAEEIVSDYAKLQTMFLDGKFSQDFGHADLTAQITLADLISQYKAEYGILPEVYFTADGVGFLIEVIPLFDGYAGFTLPIGKAKKHLNYENPLAAYAVG